MFFNFKKEILAVGISLFFVGCSDSKKDSDTPAETGSGSTTVSFSDISSIVKTSCGVSGCHGITGATSTVYENNEANFKAAKASIKDRISRAKTAAGFMPQSPGTLSDADKTKLLNYVNQ